MLLFVEMNKAEDLEALLIGSPFLINACDDNGRTALHKVLLPIIQFLLNF